MGRRHSASGAKSADKYYFGRQNVMLAQMMRLGAEEARREMAEEDAAALEVYLVREIGDGGEITTIRRNVRVDAEFKALIPPLSGEEFSQLEQNVLAEGVRDALVLWQGQNILVDGHNRLALAIKHELPCRFVEQPFESREDVLVWIIQNQFGRRNLTPFVRSELALKMKAAVAAKAKANQLAGLKQGDEQPVLLNSTEREQVNTRAELAKAADVGQDTIRKVEAVTNEAPEPIKAKARSGDLSVHRAYNMTRALDGSPAEFVDRIIALADDEPDKVHILNRLHRSQGDPRTNGTFDEIMHSGGFHYGDDMADWCDFSADSVKVIEQALKSVAKHHARLEAEARREAAARVPDDIFNVIYADPPWQYDNAIASWGPASLHYDGMPVADICSFIETIGLRVADNAVLFMWATNPFLPDALRVIEAWGFTYKTNMVWAKTDLKRPGSGFYVRGRHELLLIATRGSFLPLDRHISPPIGSVLEAPVSEHSRKPDDVYDVIERLYPNCSYVELFARRRRDGWESYGDQLS